jgi:uncharacterized membrane protein YdjX (TVP38/TMEM64 family)
MTHVRTLGVAAPIAFVALYSAAVIVLVPASILTIAAGALFGVAEGFALGFAGAVLGSLGAFLLGRHVLRRTVAAQLARMPRLAAVDRAVSAQGRRVVFLLRLSPVVPYNLLNYALGLTTISAQDFVIASLGMIPANLTYAYLGEVAGDALAAASTAAAPHGASYYVLLAVGLTATIAATIVVTRAARRALRDV